MTDRKRAAGSIRVSPGRQAQAAAAIEQQRSAIECHAARCGYVVEWYLDSGPGGRQNCQTGLSADRGQLLRKASLSAKESSD